MINSSDFLTSSSCHHPPTNRRCGVADAALQDDKRSCKHKLKSVTAKIQEKEADLRSRKVSRDSKNEMTLLMSKILARLTGQEPSETAKLSREDCRNAMIVEVHKQGDANLEYLQALSNAALLEKVTIFDTCDPAYPQGPNRYPAVFLHTTAPLASSPLPHGPGPVPGTFSGAKVPCSPPGQRLAPLRERLCTTGSKS